MVVGEAARSTQMWKKVLAWCHGAVVKLKCEVSHHLVRGMEKWTKDAFFFARRSLSSLFGGRGGTATPAASFCRN
jgi:hypothetical protein